MNNNEKSKDGGAIETPCELFSDGTIIDEMYDKKTNTVGFIIKHCNGEIEIGREDFEIGGKKYVPMNNKLLKGGALVLPSGVEDYGTPLQLFEGQVAWFKKWVDMEESMLRLCILETMKNWLMEAIPCCPILNPLGGSDTGKSRLGDTLHQVQIRSLKVGSGMISTSGLFRMAEKWKCSIYVNEADLGNSEESDKMVKFFNTRVERGNCVILTDKETMQTDCFETFGATILVSRKAFGDDGLESRCWHIIMGGRTSEHIPLNLPPEFYEEAQHWRNKLEKFRLDYIWLFKMDYELEFDGISTRLNQLLQPIASMAKEHMPELFVEMKKLAHDIDDEITLSRSESPDGLLLKAYLTIAPNLEPKSATEIGEQACKYGGENFKNKSGSINAGYIGRRCGALKFKRGRTNTERGWSLTKKQAETLVKKYMTQEDRPDLSGVTEKKSSQQAFEVTQ